MVIGTKASLLVIKDILKKFFGSGWKKNNNDIS